MKSLSTIAFTAALVLLPICAGANESNSPPQWRQLLLMYISERGEDFFIPMGEISTMKLHYALPISVGSVLTNMPQDEGLAFLVDQFESTPSVKAYLVRTCIDILTGRYTAGPETVWLGKRRVEALYFVSESLDFEKCRPAFPKGYTTSEWREWLEKYKKQRSATQ